MSENAEKLPFDLQGSKPNFSKERELGYPSLTDQKKLFAYRFLENFDHRAAAASVGISPDRALRVLREPLVSDLVSFLKKEHFKRLEVDADFVRLMWLENLEIMMGRTSAPRLGRDGEEYTAKNYDGSNVVAALRELGKMTDTYADGSGSGDISVSINLNAYGIKESEAKGVTIEGSYEEGLEDGEAPA